jgi:IS66 C-terminal element/Transposase IS66 family
MNGDTHARRRDEGKRFYYDTALNVFVSPSMTALNGCVSFHFGWCGDNALTRSRANTAWKYIGSSDRSVPSLSKTAFTLFLDDGRICLTNNAAERGLRGIALGRKAWLFAGSDRGGERAAAMYSLIITAKLNGVDPRAWLADVLARIAYHPVRRLHELLPWNWREARTESAVAA